MKERYILAVAIAADAHYGQKRRGTTSPYLVHPLAVAGIAQHYGLGDDTVLAAICHDVLEDGGDPKGFADRIRTELGQNVLRIVEGMTDPEFPKGTVRKEKKRIINERLSEKEDDIQLGKTADIKDNTLSHDGLFYFVEKRAQLDCMSETTKQHPLWVDTSKHVDLSIEKLKKQRHSKENTREI